MNNDILQLPHALSALVRRGVYTLNTADARLIGITASQIHRWKKKGFLRALGAGAYVIEAPLVSSDERAAIVEAHLRQARAVLRSIPGAYLTARSAALAYDLPVYSQPREVELTRRPWVHSRREDLLSRRPWGNECVVLANGLCVQPLAEAIIEIAGREGLLQGIVVADAAMHEGLVTREELMDAARRYGSRVGAADARLIGQLADDRIESPAESTCRWSMRFADIDVIPQVEIRDVEGGFVARVDFLVAGTRVVIEVDGLEKYTEPDELRRQARRQRALEDLGYVVIRVRTADLHDLHRVVERVKAAICAQNAMDGHHHWLSAG